MTEELKPGRELDALVAEKLFDWKWDSSLLTPPKGTPMHDDNWCAEWDDEGRPGWLPKYSTDRALMFEVLDRVKELVFSKRLRFTEAMEEIMSAKIEGEGMVCPTNWWFVVKPEDICLAALKAVDHE